MQVRYDADSDPSRITSRNVAIVGYGSQGRAHALNLRDSGVPVRVAIREGGSAESARADGFEVIAVEDAAKCDVIMMLIPDEEQPALYLRAIAPNLRAGTYLAFAHGFSVHFGTIVPRADVNVFMCAPKGPGRLVRSEYEAGRGVPALVAVHQDPSGDTLDVAVAYAVGIGAGRAGIIETNFKEETETDLFGEQAVLCGGLTALVTAGFETLVDAGYAPEMAYFECMHEVKLIVDLMYERGIEGMRDAISNTAKYGDYTRGSRVIGPASREAMKEILAEIRSGQFAREWVAEHASGKPRFAGFRAKWAAHPIERVGKTLRGLMPFLAPSDAQRSPLAASGSKR